MRKVITKILVLVVCLCASQFVRAQVGGKVFRDFNANGIHTTAAPDPIEPGLQGVTVNAYDATGTLFTATTDAAGAYSISGGTGPYRVEFILPTFYYASKGSTSNTTTQFVAAGGTADLGVNYPGDYCQTNPVIVIPNHDMGSGEGNNRIGFGSLHYDDSGKQIQYGGSTTDMTNDATVDQIGSVWGVAYQKTKKRVFTSAFLKRFAAFADGPGYVYVLDYSSGNGSIVHSFNLQGVATANGGTIDLGTITRTNIVGSISAGVAGDYELSDDRTEPTIDLDAFGKVSKMSFGDCDLSEDEKTLWLVNLYQQALVKVDVSNGSSTALPGTADQFLLNTLPGYPSVTSGVLRPFGLKFYKGKGYLGVVNDGSLGSRADLKAYVLSFDPNNIAAGFTNELAFSLDYNKENTEDHWKPWITTWAETADNSEDFKIFVAADGSNTYAQPILTDIEFQPNGDMILGFRDRLGDQFGSAYKAISGSRNTVYNYTRGDLLKACNSGSGFTIEGGSGCAVNYPGSYGVSGNGEFFKDAIGDGAQEGLSGGLAILPGTNEIVSTALDPKSPSQPGYNVSTVSSQGIHWNDLTSGAQTDWYQIEPQKNAGSIVSPWAKANGLGDIELLCNAAPIEIGNRVFMDTDEDGIQDANEMGIDGIKVELWKAGAKVIEITTANNGQWFFENLDANTDYEVKIIAANIPSNKEATLVDVGAGAAGSPEDLRDSDAKFVGGDIIIDYRTGSAGQNNHTLDFGFKAACTKPSAITFTKTPPTCTGATANNDGKITFTSATNADKYSVNTGTTSTGTYATATTVPATGVDIQSSIPNAGATYTVRFYNGSDACFKDTTIVMSAVTCVVSCTKPSAITFTKTPPTCTGATANNDGKITFTSATNADKYSVNTGTTSTGTYATATTVPATGVDIQSSIPNAGASYTVRFYNGSDACFKDTTITIAAKSCAASCNLLDGGVTVTIDEKGTASTADDEYVVYADPTGTGLAATYNVSGDITKTAVPYGVVTEIGRTSTANAFISYVIEDAADAGCSLADAAFNLNANTCLLTANPTVVCNNAGTPNDPSDDTFSISLNPTGNGIGATYNVTGAITATGISYGSLQQIATGLLISGGAKTISVSDATTPTCQLLNIKIDPPAACSGNGIAKLDLVKTVDLAEAKVGDNVIYTIKVRNTGIAISNAIEVLDTLNGNLQFVSATPSAAYNAVTGIWTVGTLPINGEATLTITAKLLSIGITQNYAEIVVGGNNDSDGPLNNRDVVCTTVPVELCTGTSFTAEIPATYSSIQWFRNGVAIPGAISTTLLINSIGDYTFTAKELATGCAADGCCPIKVVAGTNCCPTKICLGVKVTRN
jgi:uncharacterized repeat protein (TIGR01451 family)